MIDDVLVPTDGSEEAGVAVDHGVELAARFGATVHLLHVVDVGKTETAPHSEQWRREGRDLLADVAASVREQGLATETDVRTGYPADCILAYVAERGVDLVAMGTHGRTGVRRYVLGSVAESVVRRSDVPVLTVRLSAERPQFYPYENVLVPTDGSPAARAATEWALAVAGVYDATVHALSAVDPTALGVDVRSHVKATALEDAAESAVAEVLEAARGAGLAATGSVVTGPPHGEIDAYVDEHTVDMVVVGTHGWSDLERQVLGSVADRTLRTSQVPVLSVPAPGVE